MRYARSPGGSRSQPDARNIDARNIDARNVDARNVDASAPPPAAAAVLRLQGLAGNAATTQLLSGQTSTVQRDIEDEAALAQVDSLPPVVLSGGGAVPLATEEQRREFLRAGREWFGSNDATLEHFRGIEQCAVPGRPYLHRDAKARLEAVVAALGGSAPSSTVAFAFRRRFTEQTHYTPASMHTLGYAIDYDALNMPRIGRGETAELLRLVGGGPSNARLGDYAARRSVIRTTGEATAAGDAAPPQAAALLEQIHAESERLAAASQAFQASLGDARDQFFELRTRYFEAGTAEEKAAVLAETEPVIQPWIDAVAAEEQRLHAAATAAGLDPAAVPVRQQLAGRIARLDETIRQAGAALRSAGDAEPSQRSPLWRRLEQWEEQVGQPGEGTFADRVTRLTERAQQTVEALRPLVGTREALTRLASLRTRLTQPAFLFGAARRGRRGERPTTRAVADSPSMAQLLDRGFFNPGDPASRREAVHADFLVALARHGFDVGMAWAGESTDSMHMELVVPRGG
jgi:hypothetical protein